MLRAWVLKAESRFQGRGPGIVVGELVGRQELTLLGTRDYATGDGLKNGERFYADDLGAPVSEQLGSVGACPDDGEVQDSDAGEGEGFRGHLCGLQDLA